MGVGKIIHVVVNLELLQDLFTYFVLRFMRR